MAKYDPALLALLEERARRRQAEADGKCPMCDHQQFLLISHDRVEPKPGELYRFTTVMRCGGCGHRQTRSIVERDFNSPAEQAKMDAAWTAFIAKRDAEWEARKNQGYYGSAS